MVSGTTMVAALVCCESGVGAERGCQCCGVCCHDVFVGCILQELAQPSPAVGEECDVFKLELHGLFGVVPTAFACVYQCEIPQGCLMSGGVRPGSQSTEVIQDICFDWEFLSI